MYFHLRMHESQYSVQKPHTQVSLNILLTKKPLSQPGKWLLFNLYEYSTLGFFIPIK